MPVAPPRPSDVCAHLTYLVLLRRNKSAAGDAVRALQYVCHLNSWPSNSSSVHCTVSIQATDRAFAQPAKNAAPIDARMVVTIVRAAMCGTDKPESSRMLGWAILACFMCMGRFDDLCTLRWDFGFF